MKQSKLTRLSMRIGALEAEFMREKDRIKETLGVGHHGNVTIYKVKRTKVSGFTRSRFTAVRVNHNKR